MGFLIMMKTEIFLQFLNWEHNRNYRKHNMSLGNFILAQPCIMLHKDTDLYNLFVAMDLTRGAISDKRKEIARVIYDETECGARVHYDPIGFNITCIVEGSNAEFNERFDYCFPSHGLGEYLCDLEARVIDAIEDMKG